MFVILQEPLKSETFETFAINISSQDAIGIEKTGNQFGLVILKHFDAHFSNQSTIHWCICRYDTYQDCLNLMNLLLEGLVSGATCFDLRQAEKSVLQNENLPKV